MSQPQGKTSQNKQHLWLVTEPGFVNKQPLMTVTPQLYKNNARDLAGKAKAANVISITNGNEHHLALAYYRGLQDLLSGRVGSAL